MPLTLIRNSVGDPHADLNGKSDLQMICNSQKSTDFTKFQQTTHDGLVQNDPQLNMSSWLTRQLKKDGFSLSCDKRVCRHVSCSKAKP